MAFMGAMGGGDIDAMGALMADDMVWQNEGDPDLPWIGTWDGKEAIFGFLGTFSQNVQATHWKNWDAFASGDTVAVFGRMPRESQSIASGMFIDFFARSWSNSAMHREGWCVGATFTSSFPKITYAEKTKG